MHGFQGYPFSFHVHSPIRRNTKHTHTHTLLHRHIHLSLQENFLHFNLSLSHIIKIFLEFSLAKFSIFPVSYNKYMKSRANLSTYRTCRVQLHSVRIQQDNIEIEYFLRAWVMMWWWGCDVLSENFLIISWSIQFVV